MLARADAAASHLRARFTLRRTHQELYPPLAGDRAAGDLHSEVDGASGHDAQRIDEAFDRRLTPQRASGEPVEAHVADEKPRLAHDAVDLAVRRLAPAKAGRTYC